MKSLSTDILWYLIFIPFFGVVFLIITKNFFKHPDDQKKIALIFLIITFLLDLFIWACFTADPILVQVYYGVTLNPVVDYSSFLLIRKLGNNLLLVVTTMIPVCYVLNWDADLADWRIYILSVLMLESFLIGLICSYDFCVIFFFYKGTAFFAYIVLSVWILNLLKLKRENDFFYTYLAFSFLPFITFFMYYIAFYIIFTYFF